MKTVTETNYIQKLISEGEHVCQDFKFAISDARKIAKSLSAFANTQGGKLVIGIDDKTHQVVGVDKESLFPIMDSLANAISDSCEPQIIPDIEPQTIDEKTVIVVDVEAGKNRPYYIKAKGKEKGTYIRVAGTSRLAYPEKIRELEMEGARISWDELTCVGYDVTEAATQNLCKDIETFRKKAGLSEQAVRKEQLFNWKILKNKDGNVLASNAYVLLTSDYFPFSKTQCAVFKGTDRTVFLDKREYTGPIYKQIESAVEFVLRNIRLGATIDGLVRRENYELPVEAIREMIINAHCHRNLSDESCIQVAIYDDRLEITSPGGFMPGVTLDKMKEGYSKIRNRALAHAFSYMNLIEAWGSGIPKLMEAMQEYGLREPEFRDMEIGFRINLYRNMEETRIGTDQDVQKVDQDIQKLTDDAVRISVYTEYNLTDRSKAVLALIKEQPDITQRDMAAQLGWKINRVKYQIDKMKSQNIIQRIGTSQKGYWKILIENSSF